MHSVHSDMFGGRRDEVFNQDVDSANMDVSKPMHDIDNGGGVKRKAV